MMPSPNHRWYIVCLTLVNQALVIGLPIYSFALFVPYWLDAFDLSRSSVMIAITISSLATGALSPIAGRMFDRYPIRNLVLVGVLCISTALLLISQATSFWQVILIYSTLMPLGFCLCGPLPSQIMVSKWFEEKRGLAIGISAIGPNLGGLILPLSLSLLVVYYDWQGVFAIAAVAYVILLVPLNLLLLRFAPPAPEPIASGAEAPALNQTDWTTKEILSSPSFWIPLVGLIPISTMYNGVQFHLGALVLDYGQEAGLAAQLIAISAASMIAGILLCGALADRLDHRKIYWLMASSSLVSILLLINWPVTAGLILASSLNGFAMGSVPTMLSIICSAQFGTKSFGKVLGMGHLFLMSAMLGSVFSGWIFDQYQSYNVAFTAFACFLLPGIVLMRFLPEKAVPQN